MNLDASWHVEPANPFVSTLVLPSLATVSVVVMLGILAAVNYLSNRRNQRWDLTANQFNSLSEQSQKILAGLDAPLKMILVDQSLRFDAYRERLAQYANAGTRRGS